MLIATIAIIHKIASLFIVPFILDLKYIKYIDDKKRVIIPHAEKYFNLIFCFGTKLQNIIINMA